MSNTNNIESNSSKKVVILIILAAVVIGAAYLLAYTGPNFDNTPPNQANQTGEVIEASVSYVNLAQAKDEQDKLPPEWPSDIPVETEGIQEAYMANLPGTDIKVLTVVYLSDIESTIKYDQYLDYMTQAGYIFAHEGQIGPAADVPGSLYGTLDNNDLSVTVWTEGSGSRVHLNYMMR